MYKNFISKNIQNEIKVVFYCSPHKNKTNELIKQKPKIFVVLSLEVEKKTEYKTYANKFGITMFSIFDI